jgi:hypothetical protein
MGASADIINDPYHRFLWLCKRDPLFISPLSTRKTRKGEKYFLSISRLMERTPDNDEKAMKGI